MGEFRDFKVTPNAGGKLDEFLRIDRNKNRVKARISVFRFLDKDTKQTVVYSPALEISGYGETHEKAVEMIKFSISNYFDMILSMNIVDVTAELKKLGWAKEKFRNKVFSKAFVDINGQLQNLNADEETVERLTLVA